MILARVSIALSPHLSDPETASWARPLAPRLAHQGQISYRERTTMIEITDTSGLPTGTVTFLFTDIEGSTDLYRAIPAAYSEILETQVRLIRDAAEEHGGKFLSRDGDACFAVFSSASAAVAAAAAAQRALFTEKWAEDATVKVRMGLHTGEGILGGSDYVGLAVHRAARIVDAAHGGQVLLSEASTFVLRDELPAGLGLRELGTYTMKSFPDPEPISQLLVDGLPSDFSPLRVAAPSRDRLPVQLTSFIGREQELAAALDALESTRLLTLTGSGGTGKSRLSVELATRASSRFPHGAQFVPLAPISDPATVPSAILDVLGHSHSDKTPPEEQLRAVVADRSYLLVLDNFEHIIEAAPLVPTLLGASPRSKVVVTSRAPLRVAGEQVLPVPPLGVSVDAPETSEAVELFSQRARAINPTFELDHETAHIVGRLTVRLDGIPLAIELAASRTNVLSPAAILDRLEPHLLASAARDLPERQRSLHSAIGWSYDLLAGTGRRVFERFAVFRGGARLEEAEVVCDPYGDLELPVLDALALLLDNSLLRRQDLSADIRYRMLETIREYALERLVERAELAATRDRHLRAFVTLIETGAPHLTRAGRVEWLARLNADHDNIRAALAWAVEREDTDLALRFVFAAWRFWQIRGHLHEARRWVDTVLALPGGTPLNRARAIEAAGGICYWQADTVRCHRLYEDALDLYREHGDDRDVANGLYNLAFATVHLKNVDTALRLAQESLDLAERIGFGLGVANARRAIGNILIVQNCLDEALAAFQESAAAYREEGDLFSEGWAVFKLGEVSLRMRKLDEARSYLRRGLRLSDEIEDVTALLLNAWCLGGVFYHEGNEAEAALVIGAVERLADETGIGLTGADINADIFDPDAPHRITEEHPGAYATGRTLDAADLVARLLDS